MLTSVFPFTLVMWQIKQSKYHHGNWHYSNDCAEEFASFFLRTDFWKQRNCIAWINVPRKQGIPKLWRDTYRDRVSCGFFYWRRPTQFDWCIFPIRKWWAQFDKRIPTFQHNFINLMDHIATRDIVVQCDIHKMVWTTFLDVIKISLRFSNCPSSIAALFSNNASSTSWSVSKSVSGHLISSKPSVLWFTNRIICMFDKLPDP